MRGPRDGAVRMPSRGGLDGALADAASAIASMPEGEFAVGLREVEEEFRRRQRDDIVRARHASFVESLELDRAAYELARRHEADGNLGEAARWYRIAAGNDHADAALRLGRTLDRLAGSRGREDLSLVTEAAQAYAEAYAAGHPEAADRIDEMLAGFRPEPRARCGRVRDVPADRVLSEEEIRELSRHAARCTTCLAEFAGLLNSVSAALPSGPVTDPFAPED
ncbi:hypothetical protein [Actinomadura bangladeshensis]|uniref:Sel1 repeat family protein n=1 Tax=Actinomadura bangladeshensis TaxID=453573 RepID=A0A4R4NVC2_9ACTN|nr:hypothetical protein [Actinomadura bangladeshensis]TDC13741.1 hypothetical protein E1284_19170 [Actinomadura bangladeshensis]